MYLIDSPWFCWVSVRFCIGFGWISEMFCIGSAWILNGFGWVSERLAKSSERGRRRRRRTTKLELRKKVSTIAMPGAGLLLLVWGLQRGYPLWTCFLAFFNKGFIRKSAVW